MAYEFSLDADHGVFVLHQCWLPSLAPARGSGPRLGDSFIRLSRWLQTMTTVAHFGAFRVQVLGLWQVGEVQSLQSGSEVAIQNKHERLLETRLSITTNLHLTITPPKAGFYHLAIVIPKLNPLALRPDYTCIICGRLLGIRTTLL